MTQAGVVVLMRKKLYLLYYQCVADNRYLFGTLSALVLFHQQKRHF